MASVSGGSRISLPSYYAIAFTLLLIAVLFLWMFHPTIGELVMIETEIPRYEATFGFHGGWIERTLPDGTVWKAYGVVRVDPKGRLASLGFVDGDVPVAHHGDGIGRFCWVLEQADAGRAAEVWVVNPSRGADGRRKILIPGRAGVEDGR
jgi:hypothetical protein